MIMFDEMTPKQKQEMRLYIEGLLEHNISGTWIASSLLIPLSGSVTGCVSLESISSEFELPFARLYLKVKTRNCEHWKLAMKIVGNFNGPFIPEETMI